MNGSPPDRRGELAAGLASVTARIDAAARRVGRDPAGVTLVVVTKTWPASDVRVLAGLGVTDVGENRDQEATDKHRACADLPLRWHFVGQLQRNKARSVARYCDVVQSLDRAELVEALDRGATTAGRTVDVMVQVSLDRGWWSGEPVPDHRGGVPPELLLPLCARVAEAASLRLVGLMAVAPLGEDPAAAFARLHDLSARVRQRHPAAVAVSAGMSADLEPAVAAGATHVRVGSAVLGHRQRLG